MKDQTKPRRICDSWYHQKWFRILLVVVGLDMIVLGAAVAFNVDIFSLVQGFHGIVRVLGGLAYVVVAFFIIHYAISYKHLKKQTYLVCQHCAYHPKDE